MYGSLLFTPGLTSLAMERGESSSLKAEPAAAGRSILACTPLPPSGIRWDHE